MVEANHVSQLRNFVRHILKERFAGSKPEEDYRPATSKNMFLEPDEGGIEDSDKERIKQFLGDLGILP